MKTLFTLPLALLLGLNLSFAQPDSLHHSSKHTRRSDRKILELRKIVDISPEQETVIRNAYETYSRRNDSILFNVADAAQATVLKRQSEKTFNQQLLSVLTREQKRQYFSTTAAPEVAEKTAAKVEDLRAAGEYTETQLDSARAVIYNRLLAEKMVYSSEKYNYRKQREDLAALKLEQSKRQRSNRKILELKKVIPITAGQEETLRRVYIKYQQMGDSILLKVPDAATAAQLKYQSDRELHGILMSTLTEAQRNQLIRTNATPEVQAKAEAKASYLQETGYTAEELTAAVKNIFDYLMLEKVVYERDKYDLVKQKENIRLLKKLEPLDLKKANAQEKLKTQGKSVQGRTVW